MNEFDGFDDGDDFDTDDQYSTEEEPKKINKRKWKDGEKKAKKEKECAKIVKSDLKYENKELIDKTDDIAQQILNKSWRNKHRDHFFPQLINDLNLKTGVEIGVDKGEFSVQILEKSNIEKYYCVDNWMDDFGSNHKKGYYDKDGNVRYNEAKANLQKYIDVNRAIMLRMTSVEAAKKFEDNSLDYVYIDGDHSLEGITFDIYSWMPKLRIGGVCGMHDYKDGPRSGINGYFGKQLDYKVKTVVDYYCERYGHKLNPVGGRIMSCWFVKNR